MRVATVGADRMLVFGGARFRAALGTGGIQPAKREGDGGTPTGLLPLRRVLFRPDRVPPPRTVVPVLALEPDHGWCDDPAHPLYNQLVRLPFPGSHERLWRDDPLYDVVGVLGWNDRPAVPGLGSAIFLHAARPDFGGTEGCVALAPSDLVAVLAAGLEAIEVRP